MSSQSQEQILNAVEQKDAAARARALKNNNDKGNPAGPRRGKNW
jgi:hypothetical protein